MGAGRDPPEGAEGAGRGDCQATFHHLSAFLVPEDWSLASMTPIYKKGCKEDPGNYRPVSLTLVPREGYGVDHLEGDHMACAEQLGGSGLASMDS